MGGKLRQSVHQTTTGLLFAFLLSSMAICQKCFICARPVVDMPITLEKGTVLSPDFTVKHKQYIIKLQTDNSLPERQLQCMLGIHHASQPDHCDMLGFHLAVEAGWSLYADGQEVAHGTVQGRDENGEFSNHRTSRWIASFVGEKGKKYVLKITFKKDGTALRVANPHIIVELSPGFSM